jgi:hypothetical protein
MRRCSVVPAGTLNNFFKLTWHSAAAPCPGYFPACLRHLITSHESKSCPDTMLCDQRTSKPRLSRSSVSCVMRQIQDEQEFTATNVNSFVPLRGLCLFASTFPPLKRRASFIRPAGRDWSNSVSSWTFLAERSCRPEFLVHATTSHFRGGFGLIYTHQRRV